MQHEAARDLGRSARTFLALVWPQVRPLVDGGELVPVESVVSSGFARALDMLAGVDAWQVCQAAGVMRGIASRVQWISDGRRPFNTFSIRYSRRTGAGTEYAKRLRAIRDTERGWLFPHLTVQAYVTEDDRRLLSVGVVRTADLFLYAEKALDDAGPARRVAIKSNRSDGNEFIAVPWANLRRDNVAMKIWLAPSAEEAA